MIKICEIELDNVLNLVKSKSDNLIYLSSMENPIIVRTESLRCTKIIYKKSKYSNYELNVISNNDKLCEYFFESLDKKLIELGKNNKDVWFNNKEKIMYKSVFDENDLIKFKLVNSKEFNTLVFDNHGSLMSVHNYSEKLDKEFYAKLIFELVGIWIKNNKYGVYMRLHEIRVVDNYEEQQLSSSSSSSSSLHNEEKKEIEPDYILSESDDDNI